MVQTAAQAPQLSFNSILVRLRLEIWAEPLPRELMFQFHIGSIKTRGDRVLAFAWWEVSIPYWFD